MTEKETEMWTIEDLVQMTEEVQTADLDWQGKTLKIQWCELVEAEEPKMSLPGENLSDEEQTEVYKEMASARVLAMIAKANTKNPEGASVTGENWGSLPTTLRWNLQTKILNADIKESF